MSGTLEPEDKDYLDAVQRLRAREPLKGAETDVTEEEFIVLLLARAGQLRKANFSKDKEARRLCLLYYLIAEVLDPENQVAIVALTRLRREGIEGRLSKLLRGPIDLDAALRDARRSWPAKADALFRAARDAEARDDRDRAHRLWKELTTLQPTGIRTRMVRNGCVVVKTERLGTRTSGSPTVWSPDGKRVVFRSLGGWTMMNLRDRSTVLLERDRARFTLDSWSADGRYLAGTERMPQNLPAVFVYERSMDGALTPTTDEPVVYASRPVYSPDDSLLLVTRMQGDGFLDESVLGVVQLATGQVRKAVRQVPAEQTVHEEAVWTPDGNMIVSSSSDRRRGGERAIFAVPVDGSYGPRMLTHEGTVDTCPSVNPDGRRIAYTAVSRNGGSYLIKAVFLDGSTSPIAILEGRLAAWSPDGRRLAYEAPGSERQGIMIAHLGGFDSSPARFTVKQQDHRRRLEVQIRNASERKRDFEVTYEVFDLDSFRSQRGSPIRNPMRLDVGESAGFRLTVDTPVGQPECVLKLTAETPDGLRVVRLVDIALR
jgi:Tol biopolymer transport system component